MEFFLIYLFVMCGAIGSLFIKLAWVFFPVAIVGYGIVALATMVSTDCDESFEENFSKPLALKGRKWFTRLLIAGIVCLCVGKLIPSQKEMAMIVAAGVTYNVITSEPAQRIGGKALDLLEKSIDNAMKTEDNTPTKGSN